MGGYVAAVALRAVGAVSPFARPASFSCHYLGVAAFETVDLAVEPVRAGRRRPATASRSRRASGRSWRLSCGRSTTSTASSTTCRPATAWSAPGELPSAEELAGEDNPPPFPFCELRRPAAGVDRPWPPPAPLEPIWRDWLRFRSGRRRPPTRGWPAPGWCCSPTCRAGRRATGPTLAQPPFIAPTLDLQVTLHRLVPDEEWLLEGTSPVAADGLIGFTSRLWTVDGGLVATGGGQTLCRRVTLPTT